LTCSFALFYRVCSLKN